MNHDEMMDVIRANRDGQEVLFSPVAARSSEEREWWIATNPTWNFEKFDYKIKPDPIEAWALVNKSGKVHDLYYFESGAQMAKEKNPGSKIVRLVPEGGEG